MTKKKKITLWFSCKIARIGKMAKQSLQLVRVSFIGDLSRCVRGQTNVAADVNIVAGHDTERDESCLRRPVRSGSIWFARARARSGIPGKSGRTGRERRVVSMRRSLPPRSKARRISTKKPLASGKRRMTMRGIKKRVAGWRWRKRDDGDFFSSLFRRRRNHARMYRRSLGRSKRGEWGGFFGKTERKKEERGGGCWSFVCCDS